MNGGLSKIDPKWKTHIWRWEVTDVFPEKRETTENVLCFEGRLVFWRHQHQLERDKNRESEKWTTNWWSSVMFPNSELNLLHPFATSPGLARTSKVGAESARWVVATDVAAWWVVPDDTTQIWINGRLYRITLFMMLADRTPPTF